MPAPGGLAPRLCEVGKLGDDCGSHKKKLTGADKVA